MLSAAPVPPAGYYRFAVAQIDSNCAFVFNGHDLLCEPWPEDFSALALNKLLPRDPEGCAVRIPTMVVGFSGEWERIVCFRAPEAPPISTAVAATNVLGGNASATPATPRTARGDLKPARLPGDESLLVRGAGKTAEPPTAAA